MKRLFILVGVCSFLFACNDSSTTTTTSDSTTAPSNTNVENVNGNLPDTTSGMTLNHPLPVDSSRLKDSATH